MSSLAHRYVIEPARRLLRRDPKVTLPVHGDVVDCPRNGTEEDLERCMVCDRLVMLQVDAHGEGRVECRPGASTAATEQPAP